MSNVISRSLRFNLAVLALVVLWPLVSRFAGQEKLRNRTASARAIVEVSTVIVFAVMLMGCSFLYLQYSKPIADRFFNSDLNVRTGFLAGAFALSLVASGWVVAEIVQARRLIGNTSFMVFAAWSLMVALDATQSSEVQPALLIALVAVIITTYADLTHKSLADSDGVHMRKRKWLERAAIICCSIWIVLGSGWPSNIVIGSALSSLVFQTGRLSTLVFLVIVLTELKRLAPNSDNDTQHSIRARNMGVCLAMVFFLQVRTEWQHLILALTIGFVLFTRWLFVPASVGESPEASPALLGAANAGISARRRMNALRSATRALDKKLVSGELNTAEYDKQIAAYDATLNELGKSQAGIAHDVVARLLAYGPSGNVWERARNGTKYGAILTVPWLIILLRGVRWHDAPNSADDWIQFVASCAFALAQWPLYGFFLGYFFPNVRGSNGPTKGLNLFISVAGPMFVATVFTTPLEDSIHWANFSIWVMQLFIHCVLLGILVGDLETLRRLGLGWRGLATVHNMGPVLVWTSSLVVTLGAALSTMIVTGAGSILTWGITQLIAGSASTEIPLPPK